MTISSSLSPLPAAPLLLLQPLLSTSFEDAQHLPQLHILAKVMDISQQTQKLLSITPQSESDSSNQNKVLQGAGCAWAAIADPPSQLILSPSLSFYQSSAEVFQRALKDPGHHQQFWHHWFAVLSHCVFHSTMWTCHILELFARETNSFIYSLSLVKYSYSIYYLIS